MNYVKSDDGPLMLFPFTEDANPIYMSQRDTSYSHYEEIGL